MAEVVGALHATAKEAPRAISGAASWLGLAAAPSFALMALATGVWGGSEPDMLCSAMHGGSLMSGMVPMYLLMSVFHAAPWLRLITGRMHR
jgi:hypothetical protein